MTYTIDPAIVAIIVLVAICCWLAYSIFHKPKIPSIYQNHAALMRKRIGNLEAKVVYANHAIAHRDDVISDLRKVIVDLHAKVINMEDK